MKSFFHFILFSSIFISCCAVAFCIETNILLGLPLNSVGFYLFVFGATLVQYNLHYVSKTIAIDGSPRLAWTHKQKRTHHILTAIGAVMVAYSLFSFELKHYIVLLVLGGVSFLYSFPFLPFAKRKRLKDFGVFKIIILSLMWTLVTVWFPVNTAAYSDTLFTFIFIKRFIFMFVLCMVFDIRDRQVDQSQDINTLAVILGIKKAYSLTYFFLILFVIIVIIENILFPGSYLIAFLISSIATAAVIEYSKKNNSDVTCLFLVDGMMLLQAILVVLFSLKF